MHNTGTVDISRLYRLQKKMAEKNIYERDLLDPGRLRLVAGFDVAYSKRYGAVAVVALLEYPSLRLVEYGVSLGEPPLQYIPGLLAFREAPLLYAAYRRLKRKPQLVLVDGHGIAHPRFAGIATHIGLALKTPSIGVAKKKLAGEIADDGTTVIHQGKPVAKIIVHRGKKLYVSPGYGIRLDTAVNLVKSMLKNHTLPEPTYHADRISKNIARGLDRGALTPRQVIEAKLLGQPG